MRILGEIPHPFYKITVMTYNGKLSVKVEQDLLEQTFKFRDGSSIATVDDVKEKLSEPVLNQIEASFESMRATYALLLQPSESELSELPDII